MADQAAPGNSLPTDLRRCANFLRLFWLPDEIGFIGRRDPRWPASPNGEKPIPATPFTEPTDAALQCMQWRDSHDLWFTPMTFHERSYIAEDGKVKGYRKSANAKGSRALVADADCGLKKPYADRSAILKTFDENLYDFPASLSMSSGGGVHSYWLLSELVPVDLRRELSLALVGLFRDRGLHIDQQCTTDVVRFLRVNRTYNLKNGKQRLVEAIRQPLHIYRVAEVEAFLAPYKPKQRRNKTITPTEVGDALLLAELAHIGALGTVDDRFYWIAALHGIMRSCGYDEDKALPLADALSKYGAGYEGTDDVEGRLDGIEDNGKSDGPTVDTVRIWGRNNALRIAHTQAIGSMKPSAVFNGIKLDATRLDAGLTRPRTTITDKHATPLNAQRAVYYLLRWWPSELEQLVLPALPPFRDEMNRLRAAYWTHEKSHGPLGALNALEREALELVAGDPAMAFDIAHWLTAWLAGLGWPKHTVQAAGQMLELDEADARCWARKLYAQKNERPR